MMTYIDWQVATGFSNPHPKQLVQRQYCTIICKYQDQTFKFNLFLLAEQYSRMITDIVFAINIKTTWST